MATLIGKPPPPKRATAAIAARAIDFEGDAPHPLKVRWAHGERCENDDGPHWDPKYMIQEEPGQQEEEEDAEDAEEEDLLVDNAREAEKFCDGCALVEEQQ